MDVGVRAVLSGFNEARQQVEGLAKGLDQVSESGKKVESAGQGAAKGLGEVVKGGEDASAALEGLSSKAVLAAGVLGTGLAVAAGYVAKQFMEGFNNVRQAGEELTNLSQRTGVSVEELSGLTLAWRTNNLSMEQFSQGLVQFNRHISDATKETGVSSDAFARLGINVKNVSDGSLRPSGELLREVADQFKGMEDGAGKTALAIELFGRSGAQMIPLLNEGSHGFARLEEEARKAGITLSTETARAAKEVNDNLAVLKSYGEGFWMSVAGPIVEGLAEITTRMRDARREGEGFWASMYEGAKKLFEVMFLPSAAGNLANIQKQMAQSKSYIGGLEAQLITGRDEQGRPLTPSQRATMSTRLEAAQGNLAALQEAHGLAQGNVDANDPNFFSGPKKLAPTPGAKGGAGELTDEQMFARDEKYFKNLVTLGDVAEKDLLGFYTTWADIAGNNADLRVDIEARAQKLFEKILKDENADIQTQLNARASQAMSLMKRQEDAETAAATKGVDDAVNAAERRLVARRAEIEMDSSLTDSQKLKRLEALRQELEAERYLSVSSSKWRSDMSRLDDEIARQRVRVANETSREIVEIFGRETNASVSIFQGLNKGLTGVFKDILSGHINLTGQMGTFWSGMVDTLKTKFAEIASRAVLEPIFKEMKSVIDPVFKDLGNMLKDAFSGAWEWIKGLFQGTDWGSVFSGLSGSLSGVFGGGGGGGDWLSNFSSDLFSLAGFAFPTGTDSVFSNPTLLKVGDAGAERVTVSPLGGAAHARGGSPGIVNNGIMVLDEYTMRRFKKMLAQ